MGRHWSSREAWASSRWFGWVGMNVLGVDVVEDGQLDTRSLLPPCVIADPPTFGIRTLRCSVPAYTLITHSGRPVLLLSHPQVLAGGTPSTPGTFASSPVLDRHGFCGRELWLRTFGVLRGLVGGLCACMCSFRSLTRRNGWKGPSSLRHYVFQLKPTPVTY